jgi:hypothetical protein
LDLSGYSRGMKRQVITWILIIAASLALGVFIDGRVNANKVNLSWIDQQN